jgi:hypothetical protein
MSRASLFLLFFTGCVDLDGANVEFCRQRPDVCGDAGSGADAGSDGGSDAGSEADAGSNEVLGCDAPGLSAFWRFDEDGGTTLLDCGPNQVHAQVSGSALRVAGRDGGLAFSFTGNNAASVGNPAPLRLTGPMSVSAWLRISAFDEGRVITKTVNDFGWELWVSAPQQVHFGVAQSATSKFTVTTSLAAVPSGWVHVAGTWAADGQLSLYVNGVVAKQLAGPTSGFDADAGVLLGEGPSCCRFSGQVDELRVFSRALTAQEVATLAR